MNSYKIVSFDGYNKNSVIIQACDIVSAIQCSGQPANQIVLVKLLFDTDD